MSAELVVATDGPMLTVRIARPPGNLFTSTMCGELAALLAAPPPSAQVIVLRGSPEAFCLGRERPGADVVQLREEVVALVGLNRALVGCPVVTVAEVLGDAAGYGVGLASLCDVAVASSTARFSFPEVMIGLAPSLVLAWLVGAVGRRAALWLTATGVSIDGVEAARLGLVNEAVPPGELEARTAAVLGSLTARSARVQREVKGLIALFDGLGEEASTALATDRLVLASLARLQVTEADESHAP